MTVACILDLDIDEAMGFELDAAEVQRICDVVLRSEGVRRTCYLSLSVVSDARMQELNGEWRGIDRPTDVLSLECERPDDPSLADDEPCELGDVVLAPRYIAAQAANYGTTAADETRLLLVHGMLHLLGYDHMREDEALVMEAKEDKILGLLGTDAEIPQVVFTRHLGKEA